MTIKEKLKQVNQIFNENNCGFEAYPINDMVEIDIEWGDWKHDHTFADYVMSQHGFVYVDEHITEEDGSDTYSSIHYYKMK